MILNTTSIATLRNAPVSLVELLPGGKIIQKLDELRFQ